MPYTKMQCWYDKMHLSFSNRQLFFYKYEWTDGHSLSYFRSHCPKYTIVICWRHSIFLAYRYIHVYVYHEETTPARGLEVWGCRGRNILMQICIARFLTVVWIYISDTLPYGGSCLLSDWMNCLHKTVLTFTTTGRQIAFCQLNNAKNRGWLISA